MRIKSFTRKDWTILIILLTILVVAAAVLGTRGIFLGVVLLYVNASLDIIQQIRDRYRTGQVKKAVSNLLAFSVVSIVVLTVFWRLFW